MGWDINVDLEAESLQSARYAWVAAKAAEDPGGGQIVTRRRRIHKMTPTTNETFKRRNIHDEPIASRNVVRRHS